MTSPGGGQQSRREIADLQRRQETPPLLPDGEPLLARGAKVEVVDSVPVADQRRTAAPVYDLAALAGALGESRRRLSAGDEDRSRPARARQADLRDQGGGLLPASIGQSGGVTGLPVSSKLACSGIPSGLSSSRTS